MGTKAREEARWKAKEEALTRQFNEQIKSTKDNISNLQNALEAKTEVERRNVEKIRILDESLVIKETIIVKQEEKLASIGQVEIRIGSLEREKAELYTKLNITNEEKKRLMKEKVQSEILVKED